MHLYLHLCRSVVVYLTHLYLALFYGAQYRVYERCCCLSVRYLAYYESLVVKLLYLCTHFQCASALSVVISSHVDAASRGEVRIEYERLAVQITDGCIAYIVEVVRKYFRRKPHGYALRSLCKEQRKLCRQCYRFLVTPVVTQLPLRCLGVEHHVKRKLRQARLYVTRRRGTVARENVAPVSLTVNKQVFLSQLHESVAYRGIAVRMELHGVSYDVSYLVVAPVVHSLHRVQYAPLHRLQSVADMRHRPFKYHVWGIVEKPTLIHAAKVVHSRCVETVHRLVVRVFLVTARFLWHFLYFVVHFDVVCLPFTLYMMRHCQKYEVKRSYEQLCGWSHGR